MEIKQGDLVHAETAAGTIVELRALGPATQGRDFLVVWVCNPEEWDQYGPEADAVPWPAEYVQECQHATA